MTDNVVTFRGLTKLPLPPEKVLAAALNKPFDRVTVIGIMEDGEEYVASSTCDCGAILWDMERARHLFMKNADT
jgi:hypothetical protein